MGASNEPYWETGNIVLVTAKLRQEDDGNWELNVNSKIGDSRHQMHGAGLTIPSDKMEWMKNGLPTDGRVIGSEGTKVVDPKGTRLAILP